MASQILVNTGASNGLLSDGTNILPEPVLTSNFEGFIVFVWEEFHSGLKMNPVSLLPYLTGANELTIVLRCRVTCHIIFF